MSESQDYSVSNAKLLVDSESSKICLEKESDFTEISNVSDATFDFATAPKTSPENITKYFDEIGINMDEFISNSKVKSDINDSKSNVTQSEKIIELDFCEHSVSENSNFIYEDAETLLKEEFFDANQFFNDPSSLDYLEHAGSSNALSESSMARSSLYEKFDPLHAKFFPQYNIESNELRESVNENAPELNDIGNTLAYDDLDRKVKTEKPHKIINDALLDEAENNLVTSISRDMYADESQSDTTNKHLSNSSLQQSFGNMLISFDTPKNVVSFDSEVLSESQNSSVSNENYLVDSESSKICLEKDSDFTEIPYVSETTFDLKKAPKTSPKKLSKYFDEIDNNMDEFITNFEHESDIKVSKSSITQSEKLIDLCEHSGTGNSNFIHEYPATELKEFFDANQYFNDASSLNHLEHAGSSKLPSESSMARSSLYQKFDPLYAKFFPQYNIESNKLIDVANEFVLEMINFGNSLVPDDLDRKVKTEKHQKIIHDALLDEAEINLESNISHDMHADDSQSDTINKHLSNSSLQQSFGNMLISFDTTKNVVSFDSEVMSEFQNSSVSNTKLLVDSESSKICLEKESDFTEISNVSETTFDFMKTPKTSPEKLAKYCDEIGSNMDEFVRFQK